MTKLAIILSSSIITLSSCSHSGVIDIKHSIKIEKKEVASGKEESLETPEDFLEEHRLCPEEMANIDDLFCIDKYEASIIDKNTGMRASPHYIASRDGFENADKQYQSFREMEVDQKELQKKLVDRITRNLSLDSEQTQKLYQRIVTMPTRGAEQFPGFEPQAVSLAGKVPASYVTRIIAEKACTNAGKRLCSRDEWYKTCVGSGGLEAYLEEEKEEFPQAYPYGPDYEKNKCNMGMLKWDMWPPGILGRRNNGEMMDPRIAALPGVDGLPIKRKTGSFEECSNEYGVYDMVGNVHEIISDIYLTRSKRQRSTYVGSHLARRETQSCAEATEGHWFGYTDYSIGFRCCTDIKKE